MDIRKYFNVYRYKVARGRKSFNKLFNFVEMADSTVKLVPTSPATRLLCTLPYVPLLRILRFLDEASLEKLSLTSRTINQFIVRNRNQFVWRNVRLIEIIAKGVWDARMFYVVFVMLKTKKMCEPFHIVGCTLALHSQIFLWLVEKVLVENSYVRELKLVNFCFGDDNLEESAQDMLKMKIRIKEIKLYKTSIGSNPSDLIRFMTTLRPEKVIIKERKEDKMRPLFTEPFFSFVATLDCFLAKSNDPYINIPENVLKIPRNFYTQSLFIMPLATIVKAIRVWYDSAETFGHWCISVLYGECADVADLMNTVNRPFVKNKMTNRGRKSIQVSSQPRNRDYTVLTISRRDIKKVI